MLRELDQISFMPTTKCCGMQPGYGKYTRIGRHCSPVSFCLCLTASSETFLSYRTTKCQGFTDLSKEGRGYVIVDESKADFIVYNPAFAIDPEGKIGTTDGQGKGWILSVYHQLHCLVSTLRQMPALPTGHALTASCTSPSSNRAWAYPIPNLPHGTTTT
jgi:hypothetical protein